MARRVARAWLVSPTSLLVLRATPACNPKRSPAGGVLGALSGGRARGQESGLFVMLPQRLSRVLRQILALTTWLAFGAAAASPAFAAGAARPGAHSPATQPAMKFVRYHGY